jgi:acyl dehydratase
MDIFDNIFINQEEEILHVITEEDVDNFAKLTNDTNPLHMCDEFASGTQFRKRVVHGMLTASFISTIIGTKLPGPGSLWFEQNIKFNLPVRINDKIRVVAKVLHKSPISRIIILSTIVYNENGKEVITGEAKVKVPEYKKKVKLICL